MAHRNISLTEHDVGQITLNMASVYPDHERRCWILRRMLEWAAGRQASEPLKFAPGTLVDVFGAVDTSEDATEAYSEF